MFSCVDKDAFISYSLVGNEEELVYLEYFWNAKVLQKGKILLKLTLGKTLTFNNMLHVPNIWTNLIFCIIIGKGRVKVSFESDKDVLT